MPGTNANLRFAFSKIKSDIFNAIASVLSTVGRLGNGHSNPKLSGSFFADAFVNTHLNLLFVVRSILFIFAQCFSLGVQIFVQIKAKNPNVIFTYCWIKIL